jgi:prolyl-tRNA editing enzyme YbaK/EbsC (Cys-tRNA(Pro) deacylase)
LKGLSVTDRLPDGPRKAGSAERVRAVLAAHDMAERIITFGESTKTAQQAADAVGCELGQIVKSLVVTGPDGQALVLTAGDRRGDLAAVAVVLGREVTRMANAEEVRAATGYAIGGVSPFDLPEELPVLIDDSLLRFPTVYSAAGTPNSGVPLSLDELGRFSGGRIAPVSKEAGS